MTQPPQFPNSFFPRDWIFSKLLSYLRNNEPGVVLIAGPGAGKTSICRRIIRGGADNENVDLLHRRLLGHYEGTDPVECVYKLGECVNRWLNKVCESNGAKQEDNLRNLFDNLVLKPLLSSPEPKERLILIVDSIDKGISESSISELLATVEFPRWVLPVLTARKQGKAWARFVNYKKVYIDDLRRKQVTDDTQQYILSRLDSNANLRLLVHSQPTSMSQLHIKSNGCFLYLSKVLDGLSDNFIALREVREIPGTLYGYYTWMCARLFKKRQFNKVRLVISIIIASENTLSEDTIYALMQLKCRISKEDFIRRMRILSRVVVKSDGVGLFHDSFGEWIQDVKYCSHRFYCDGKHGHELLVIGIGLGIVNGDLEFHARRSLLFEEGFMEMCVLSLGMSGDDKLEQGRVTAPLLSLDPASVTDPEPEFLGGGEAPCCFSPDEDLEGLFEENTRLDVNNLKQLLDLADVQDEVADSSGRTPLNLAARQGNLALVEAILKRSPSVNLADSDGCTPLRSACWAGHGPVVQCLLRHQADAEIADNEGRSPLIAAAYMGHSPIVSHLLQTGADVNHSDSDGRSALSVAANRNHSKVLSLLLEKNASVNHRDKNGATPLIVASFEGHRQICEVLLEYGAEIDLADKLGRTSLWAAASMGHTPVADILLFWGAYVDNIDGQGRTVLSVASAQGNVGVVRLLLERGLDEGHRDNSGWTPLHYAAFEGHESVVEALLEYGAKVNDTENNGKSAVILAAEEAKLSVVQILVKWGAELGHCSHDGRNALRSAALSSCKDIVQLCLAHRLDVNYRDSDGRTTLYVLALESRISMSQFFIKCGANVELRDLEGRAPIHVSAWQGHLEMTELLVSAGASVNATDNDKRTPLHSASWQGHHTIVRLLCECGADVDHACNQGATGLCIAAQEGHLECVRTLLEFGANPNQGSFGRTPIRVSLKSGHSAISRLLEAAAEKRLKLDEANSVKATFEQDKTPADFPESPTYACPPAIVSTDKRKPSHGNGVLDKRVAVAVNDNAFPAFAFSRDSHMKIILGCSESAAVKPSKKNGLNGSAGISALRSGINALRSGFDVSRKESSVLVSAASMAVPSFCVKGAGAEAVLKRETPL